MHISVFSCVLKGFKDILQCLYGYGHHETHAYINESINYWNLIKNIKVLT